MLERVATSVRVCIKATRDMHDRSRLHKRTAAAQIRKRFIGVRTTRCGLAGLVLLVSGCSAIAPDRGATQGSQAFASWRQVRRLGVVAGDYAPQTCAPAPVEAAGKPSGAVRVAALLQGRGIAAVAIDEAGLTAGLAALQPPGKALDVSNEYYCAVCDRDWFRADDMARLMAQLRVDALLLVNASSSATSAKWNFFGNVDGMADTRWEGKLFSQGGIWVWEGSSSAETAKEKPGLLDVFIQRSPSTEGVEATAAERIVAQVQEVNLKDALPYRPRHRSGATPDPADLAFLRKHCQG